MSEDETDTTDEGLDKGTFMLGLVLLSYLLYCLGAVLICLVHDLS